MSQLGTYEFLFELASGGMGTVELAVARGAFGVERLVAIKRIRPHLTETNEVVSRFLDEARIISQLHHANVVGVHHASEDQRGYFLVFDYVEGETLSGLIDLANIRDERMPLPIVIRVILDGLNGLNAAHEAKNANGEPLHILHRDVSRQNLIVGTDGVTRLSDFGISKSTMHSTVTSQSYLAGKLIYMAPEYLSRAAVDRRMDIYAMGVTLWTAIAGREPWPEEGEAHTMTRIMTEGVPTLSASGVSVAPEIEAIVARACQPRPADRYATARQMIDALEEFGRHGGSIASQMEVAEYVESMAGEYLEDRRKMIAERLATRGTPFLSTEPPPPGTHASQETGAASTTYAGATDNVTARWRYVAAGAAIVALVAGIAVVARGPRASGTPVLAPSSFGPAAAPTADTATPVPAATPIPAATPVPAATPEIDRAAGQPIAAPSASQVAPSASQEVKSLPEEPRPPVLAAPRAKRASPAGSTPASAPAIPTQISTANPYR